VKSRTFREAMASKPFSPIGPQASYLSKSIDSKNFAKHDLGKCGDQRKPIWAGSKKMDIRVRKNFDAQGFVKCLLGKYSRLDDSELIHSLKIKVKIMCNNSYLL
jgi:hypothetical protein